MKRIVFDMDGVLTNFEKNVYLVSQELFPGKMPEGYVPQDWDYSDIFTKTEWNAVWKRIKEIPDFWYRQPEITEAVDALKNFRTLYANPIWFITSRIATGGVSAKYQTELWLLSRGIINIRQTGQVIAVTKPEEKKRWVEELKADVSIDDYGPTIERHNAIPNHTAFLLRQPWNKEYTNQPSVGSVKEFLERVI